MTTRRSLITSLATLVAAPAIVRVSSIMPLQYPVTLSRDAPTHSALASSITSGSAATTPIPDSASKSVARISRSEERRVGKECRL